MVNKIVKQLVFTTLSVAALSLGIQGAATSATFVAEGENAPGDLMSTAAGTVDSQYDKIQGTLLDGGDIHLYQLQMDFDGTVKFDASAESFGDAALFVFNETGEGVDSDFNSLSFDFKEDEVFYLGINVNANPPLNEEGEALLDPNFGKVNDGTLVAWEKDDAVILPLIPYEISLDVEDAQNPQAVPEPSAITGLVLALGMGAYHSRQKK